MSMDKFFSPASVAVIGASTNPAKVGYAVLNNIIKGGFNGKIFPINPKATEILGKKAYPSVEEVKEDIDLAVIIVPAKFVPSVMEQCGKKKITAVIVISAGFKEIGHEGAVLEKKLIEICKKYGIRMLGPNVLGLTSYSSNTLLNATFAPRAPIRGSIAFISQSGAMLTSILDWSLQEGIGFSKFVSLGNKADLTSVDFIEALSEDPETKVILLYLENIVEGERFLDIAEKTKKPIVILKSGTSSAGAKAASSHTGALAGADIAYEMAFRQSGVIRAMDMQSLFDYAIALSTQPIPEGKGVAIVTNAGGPGIICTDAVEKSGLRIAGFLNETINKLREGLPAAAAVLNPIDVLGDADSKRYEFALRTCLQDDHVDMAIVLMSPQAMTEFEETAYKIIEIAPIFKNKPIVTAFMGGKSVEKGAEILTKANIPCFDFPERGVKALKGLSLFSDYQKALANKEPPIEYNDLDKAKVDRIFKEVRADGRLVLLEPEAVNVAAAYGIPVPKVQLTKSPDEAVEVAEKFGFPVVMKICSPQILHKSDLGGVIIGINNPQEVRNAYRTIMDRVTKAMPTAQIYGIEVQEMIDIPNYKEIIIGMNRDPQFGPLIMTGLGGIYVNFLQDVSFRLNHKGISRKEAFEMVSETKVYSLLKGARGEPPYDIDSLVDTICRVGKLCKDYPIINELDVNPLFVFEKGKNSIALDVKITLSLGDEQK
ncbi:MAG: acetate--CoA ligase alpha subunit [Candidatus Helarchaeota archaeon]